MSQRERLRRTIEAPNGARIVYPTDTTEAQLLNVVLKWYYEDAFTKDAAAISPLHSPLREAP